MSIQIAFASTEWILCLDVECTYLIRQGAGCQIPGQERYAMASVDSKTENVIKYKEFN
jgi:hypothetical protein